MPVFGQLLDVHAEIGHDSLFVIESANHVLEQLGHGQIAVAAPDVGPDRLPVAVGEIFVGVLEILDRGQLLLVQEIPHPHGGQGVHRTDGKVLGRTFDHPHGGAFQAAPLSSALLAVFLPGAGGDVVLKGMDELVADDVIGVLERRPEGQDDAALARFGDAARAFAHHLAEDGRLLELGMAGVHDERLLAPQVVVEQAGVAFVPPLGHLAGDLDGLFLFGIVIDVEMLGLEHPVIEFLPLDLVPAEILAEGGRQADARPRRGQDDAQDQLRIAVLLGGQPRGSSASCSYVLIPIEFVN